jgi:hypothetical protein
MKKTENPDDHVVFKLICKCLVFTTLVAFANPPVPAAIPL